MCKTLYALLLLSATAVSAETLEISIVNMKYVPEVLTVRPGDTVRWVNNEKRSNHSVYFKAEGLPDSERLFPGDSHQRTFDKAGSYPYECGPHPEMTGRIEVVQ